MNPYSVTAADNSAVRWGEAARLRREHRGWAVVWQATFAEFRAYRHLPGTQGMTVLTAATSQEIAAQIREAERAVASTGG